MEDKYFTLLLVAIIVLILLLAASLALLAWLLLKSRGVPADPSPLVPTRKPKFSRDSRTRCPNHPDKPTSGKCALCEKNFCGECLLSPEGPSFCRDHIGVYLETSWAELGEIKTTPDAPHKSEHLYRLKKELLRDGEIPSFILTNYKINTETDSIESYVCLCVPQSKRDEVLVRLESPKL